MSGPPGSAHLSAQVPSTPTRGNAMTTADTTTPTRQELVDRARALVPLLAEHAADTDTSRVIDEQVLDAITTAGLLRLGIPRRLGGIEAPVRTQMEVAAALAEGCGSTAWVVHNMNASAISVGMLPLAAQAEVWAENPDGRVVASMGPVTDVRRTEGGFLVSGKVSWLSGLGHADWALVGMVAPAYEEQPARLALGLVPVEKACIEDSWFVTGMRGTSTNTLVLDDQYVPDHRLLDIAAALEGTADTGQDSEALYRSPFLVTLAIVLSSSQIGLARAALSLVVEKAPKRAISYTIYGRQDDSVGFHVLVGQAALQIDMATAFLYATADGIDSAAAEGRTLTVDERLAMRASVAAACKQLREAVSTLVDAHGTSAFAEINPLQRIWRDINTGSRHAMLNAQVGYEAHGANLLGLGSAVIVPV